MLLYIVLIFCLVASNISRLLWMFNSILKYLTQPREPQLIPYFDEDGNLIGLVRIGPDSTLVDRPHSRAQPIILPGERDGEEQSQTRPSSPGLPHSFKALVSVLMLHVAALNTRPDISSLKLIAFTWDFWPDGEFRSHVSHQQLWDTNQLATNWVLETTLKRGSTNARTWQRGHELRRQCLGVVEFVRAREIENQMSTSGVVEWEARFKAAHTVFENSTDLVFYHRDGGWNPEIIPSLPAVNIGHNGRTIKLPADLPLLPSVKQRGVKRPFVGEDVFGNGPAPKRRKETGSKKYEPKPTPPHARRSTRLRKKKA
ncbi:hypothetical protein B0H11DRAFT_1907569 [Mycena galericulata]|nr:hypothetical protein B0H11DRAFT_1907569 [Mycena galericulata]